MRQILLLVVLLIVCVCLLLARKEGMINGTDDDISRYPWFVSFPVSESGWFNCGGSVLLFYKRTVLQKDNRLAHCQST